jgi:DNA-binding MarR family transcriptional regulator
VFAEQAVRTHQQHRNDQSLVAKQSSHEDGRSNLLSLTDKGRVAFEPLDGRSRDQIADLLIPLSDVEQAEFVAAMAVVERLLGSPSGSMTLEVKSARPSKR